MTEYARASSGPLGDSDSAQTPPDSMSSNEQAPLFTLQSFMQQGARHTLPLGGAVDAGDAQAQQAPRRGNSSNLEAPRRGNSSSLEDQAQQAPRRGNSSSLETAPHRQQQQQPQHQQQQQQQQSQQQRSFAGQHVQVDAMTAINRHFEQHHLPTDPNGVSAEHSPFPAPLAMPRVKSSGPQQQHQQQHQQQQHRVPSASASRPTVTPEESSSQPFRSLPGSPSAHSAHQRPHQRQHQGGGGGGSSHHSRMGPEQEQTKQLLRQINTIPNKEGILEFITTFLPKLDPINMVTCLYRLAKMYNGLRSVGMKHQWRSELSRHPVFLALLDSIKLSIAAARQAVQTGGLPHGVRGLDARCISNLVWALVRLELASDSSSSAAAMVLDVALLVEHYMPQCRPQGLASLLWGYAKLPQPPLRISMLLVRRITELLAEPGGVELFDAQALSNSVWALAHIASTLGIKASDLLITAATEAGADVKLFLTLVGNGTNAMLGSLHMGMTPDEEVMVLDSGVAASAWLQDAEHKFSCQSLVNIAWSFMTLLGNSYAQYDSVHLALRHIRLVVVRRLRATKAALRECAAGDAPRFPGGFNEQALSNLVCAFDDTLGLDDELMRSVFFIAAQRIRASGNVPAFKPKELGSLLRAAARMPTSEPWDFLAALTRVVDAGPAAALASWQPNERDAYERAVSILRCYEAALGGSAVPQQHHLGVRSMPHSPQHQHQQQHLGMQHMGGIPHMAPPRLQLSAMGGGGQARGPLSAPNQSPGALLAVSQQLLAMRLQPVSYDAVIHPTSPGAARANLSGNSAPCSLLTYGTGGSGPQAFDSGSQLMDLLGSGSISPSQVDMQQHLQQQQQLMFLRLQLAAMRSDGIDDGLGGGLTPQLGRRSGGVMRPTYNRPSAGH